MKQTVLRFLGEVSYKRVVLKTVEFNEVNLYQEASIIISGLPSASQMDNYDINILLLDNVKEHKRVLELFNRIQIHNIAQGKPKEFLLPNLEKNVLEEVIKKKLKAKGAVPIPFVGVQKSKLVNDKIRDNHFAKYPRLKAEFDHLKYLTEAINFIIEGDVKQAQATFEKLKSLLPILDS